MDSQKALKLTIRQPGINKITYVPAAVESFFTKPSKLRDKLRRMKYALD
ncbi:MAG: hypothetical protein KQH63_08215 [Desulfobulbaceae bacterium]|nr:hypothetical protein [Desulfobulbaceae bacterium]